jgi:hypothetical protein
MPPEFGKAAASSAVAGAPHNVIRPPSPQTDAVPQTDPAHRWRQPAGTRKIPLPMMVPMTSAVVAQNPAAAAADERR